MFFKKLFSSSHVRSEKALKNIGYSFIIKGISIAINLALVPLTINYLSPSKYGVWLTISSILGWVDYFDVGLGHGLRNKLAESMALNQVQKAKSYVSTAYISISALCILFFGVFAIINQFIDWNTLLNIPEELDEDIKTITFIVFAMFSVRFILQLINSIFLGLQETAKVSFNVMASNLLVLVGIIVIMQYSKGSLLIISVILSVVPVLILAGVNLYYFKFKLKNIAPSIRSFDFSSLKDILHLGVKFFIIQITILVFFQTSSLLISIYFSPELVTPYYIAFKYFGIITMVFNIIISPYWSAYTEAYAKHDFEWMKRSLRQLLNVWGILVVVSIIMLLFSDYMYSFWVGDKVKVDFSISLFLMIYVVLTCFGDIYIRFLNGIGNIRMQMIVNIIGMLAFVPLSYLFAVILKLGVVGIVITTIICSLYGPLIAPFQVKKIFNKFNPAK